MKRRICSWSGGERRKSGQSFAKSGAAPRYSARAPSARTMRAAHAAGLPAIACSFGFLMQPVEELGAEQVIDSFAELIPALERLA